MLKQVALDPAPAPGGDFSEGRVSLGGWRVIHSSRSRNGVQVDDVQQVQHLRDSFLCAATYIGR
jgi:hypothetical protein